MGKGAGYRGRPCAGSKIFCGSMQQDMKRGVFRGQAGAECVGCLGKKAKHLPLCHALHQQNQGAALFVREIETAWIVLKHCQRQGVFCGGTGKRCCAKQDVRRISVASSSI